MGTTISNRVRHPGLDRESRVHSLKFMDREQKGGWVYIMADRYRGAMYVGVTSDLSARIVQHREGRGSEFCSRYGLKSLVWAERGGTIEDCIAHEKRVKRWRREWKFALIEKDNPDWLDLFDHLAGA